MRSGSGFDHARRQNFDATRLWFEIEGIVHVKFFARIVTPVILAIGLLAGVGFSADAAAAPAPHAATPVSVVPASHAASGSAPSLNSAPSRPADGWTRYLSFFWPNTTTFVAICILVAAEYNVQNDHYRYACMAFGSGWSIFRQPV
jgi:hypothetical protein